MYTVQSTFYNINSGFVFRFTRFLRQKIDLLFSEIYLFFPNAISIDLYTVKKLANYFHILRTHIHCNHLYSSCSTNVLIAFNWRYPCSTVSRKPQIAQCTAEAVYCCSVLLWYGVSQTFYDLWYPTTTLLCHLEFLKPFSFHNFISQSQRIILFHFVKDILKVLSIHFFMNL